MIMMYDDLCASLSILNLLLFVLIGVWPPYASYLCLEVAESSQDPSKKFVRAIYNDEEKVMLGCGTVWCPYETFHSRLESMTITHSEYSASAQCSINGEVVVDEDLKATLGSK